MRTSAVTGEPVEQACWFLIDPDNGEISWWLTEEIVEPILNWDGLYVSYEAALSPDNKWIVINMMNAPIRVMAIISLETNEPIVVGNFVVEKIYWGD